MRGEDEMAEIIQSGIKKRRPRDVRGEAVWAARDRMRAELDPATIDAKVWAICPWLKQGSDEVRCFGCPEWEHDERFGKISRMCRGLAEEVVAVALYHEPDDKRVPPPVPGDGGRG